MTYAIFAIGSRQFKAEPGLTLKVPKLTAEPGSTVTFDRVLLTSDGKAVQTGAPLVQGAKVMAEVVRHGRNGFLLEETMTEGEMTAAAAAVIRDVAERPERYERLRLAACRSALRASWAKRTL